MRETEERRDMNNYSTWRTDILECQVAWYQNEMRTADLDGETRRSWRESVERINEVLFYRKNR